MRLAIASDLHLDSYEDDVSRMMLLQRVFNARDYDVAVVAGDTSNFRGWHCSWDHALTLLMQATEGKPVVMVLGNHDWSHAKANLHARAEFQEARERFAGRLHLLDRATCVIEGQRFVGCTNWYDPGPRVQREDLRWYDYKTIPAHRRDIMKKYVDDTRFLQEALIGPKDVVVTHMLPHEKCVNEKYRGLQTNKYFVSSRPQVDTPKAWIFGHTHIPVSIDNCHARPLGYMGELSQRVQNALPRVIEV